jgi:glycosyltransferase involved in cell wall biosynthesis
MKRIISPKKVIVVDDGSEDDTLQILRAYKALKFELIVKSRPERKGGISLVGTPSIATTFNEGFRLAKKVHYEYLMILGSDTILEKKYIEKLLYEFTKEKSLAIASGQSKTMLINPSHARGSGRMIDYRFWKDYGEEYPIIYGWEDDCLIQCQRIGLKVRSFPHINFESTRRDQGTIDFINWGRAARSMSYHPIVVFLRAVRFLLLQKYGTKSTVRYLAGYMSTPVPEQINYTQQQNRVFFRRYQLIQIPRKLFSFFS